jgi:F-type H+-transporting ATPase subunit delta
MSRPTRHELAKVIVERLAAGGVDAADLARDVAAYLIAEHRTGELDGLLREVRRLRAENGGPVEATVRTARPLDEPLRAEVRALVGQMTGRPGQTVILDESVEPGLLGGVYVETDDSTLDATVRQQLRRLKHLPVH